MLPATVGRLVPALTASTGSESDLDIIVNEYRITGTGPNGAKFDGFVDAEHAVVSYDSLAVGEWRVKARAIDKNNVLVGEGSARFYVEEGKENAITIDVKEQDGKGKLVVSINYSATSSEAIVCAEVTPEKDSGKAVTEPLIKDGAGNNAVWYAPRQ